MSKRASYQLQAISPPPDFHTTTAFVPKVIWRRLECSGMLRCVDWTTVTDVSKERSAFIFRVKQSLSTRYHILCDLNPCKLHHKNYKFLNMRLLSSCYLSLAQKNGFLHKIYTTCLKVYSSWIHRHGLKYSTIAYDFNNLDF